MEKIFNAAADVFAIPDTWQNAVRRILCGIILVIGAVMLGHWLHTCAPAFAVGYAIGGLTIYGSFVRKGPPR